MGSCVWSRPVLWSSILPVSHKRWQWYYVVAGPKLPDHCQKIPLLDWPLHRSSSCSPPGPTTNKNTYVSISTVTTIFDCFQLIKLRPNQISEWIYLLKDLPIGLFFFFFTKDLSGAQTECLTKSLHSMYKKFVQRVDAFKVLCNESICAFYRPIRPFWTSTYTPCSLTLRQHDLHTNQHISIWINLQECWNSNNTWSKTSILSLYRTPRTRLKPLWDTQNKTEKQASIHMTDNIWLLNVDRAERIKRKST